MQIMFKDMSLSRELMTEWEKQTRNPENVEIVVDVLTASTWNIPDSPACNIPVELKSL